MLCAETFIFAGLTTVVAAHHLGPRMAITDVKCGTQAFTKAEVGATKSYIYQLEDEKRGSYPKYFGNRGNDGQSIFNTNKELWEFPLTRPTYNGKNIRPRLYQPCF